MFLLGNIKEPSLVGCLRRWDRLFLDGVCNPPTSQVSSAPNPQCSFTPHLPTIQVKNGPRIGE